MKCDICNSEEVTHSGHYLLCHYHSKMLRRFWDAYDQIGTSLSVLRKLFLAKGMHR